MKNQWWFNPVFMFFITLFFSSILVTLYVSTEPLIAANQRLNEMRALLNAFHFEIPVGSTAADIEDVLQQRVEETYKGDFKVYTAKDEDGNITSYGFIFSGSGLWGDIKGILALNPELTHMVGLDFTEQNETPGLGGRIDETWFKDQFRGIELFSGDRAIQYSSSSPDGQVDSITGATSSSNAVLNILNDRISEIRKGIGGEK